MFAVVSIFVCNLPSKQTSGSIEASISLIHIIHRSLHITSSRYPFERPNTLNAQHRISIVRFWSKSVLQPVEELGSEVADHNSGASPEDTLG